MEHSLRNWLGKRLASRIPTLDRVTCVWDPANHSAPVYQGRAPQGQRRGEVCDTEAELGVSLLIITSTATPP